MTTTRLCHRAWRNTRIAVYNANYAANGDKILDLIHPWTVISPITFQTFRTHKEAATYAFKGMTK